MKLKIYLVITVIVLGFSLMLSSCGIAAVETKHYKKTDKYNISEDYVINESSEYIFSFSAETGAVILKNKEGKTVWSTSPVESYEERYDEYGEPLKLHSKAKSAIIIEYIEPTTSKVSIAYSYKESVSNKHFSIKKIKDGVEVTYYFEEQKISVPVEYTFKDNTVRVKIDPKGITEDKNKLYSVLVAPFACGISNLSSDGYLFVPSGSGAIIRPCQLEEGSYSYSRELYGNDATRHRERELDTDKYPENRMAVYGAKISESEAVCAIIEDGAEHAFIEAEAGAANIGYSSVWAKFAFRAYQWSKIKNEQQVKLYSGSMSQDSVSVAFKLLNNDNADYVGMADAYRQYLTEKYGMKPLSSDSLLNLKIVGGANITETFLGFKYDKFFTATTLKQAENIIKELSQTVSGKINADLIGFGKSGIDIKKIAGGYSVNDKLGGKKELKQLAEVAEKNNCNLYFNADVLGLSKSGSGISKTADTALSQDKRKIKQYYYNIYLRKKTVEHKPYFLVARELVPDVTKKLGEEFSETGIHGLGLDTLSSVCYSDYRNADYFNKGKMSDDVVKSISSLKKNNYAIAVNEANDYAASVSDIIYDTPLTSSKNNMFSFDVPFYSIVFKGYIPISTPSVNLAANSELLILRAAEVGAGLSYTVIDNGSTKLFDSFSSVFYGSVYNDIKSDIKEDIKAYQKDFELVKNAKIIDHVILENGLNKTVFENNITVYTNYSQETLSAGKNTVQAGRYLFVKE